MRKRFLSRVKQACSPLPAATPVALPAKKLIAIGYWRSVYEPQLPDPAWFVDLNWSAIIRQQVVDYLSQGRQLFAWMGFSWCRFRCEAGKHLGAWDFTDSTYSWPEGLAHYVAHHKVRLPDEIVAHILAQPAFPHAMAEQVPETEETLRATDKSWWTSQRGWNPDTNSFWIYHDDEARAYIRRVERGQMDFNDDSEVATAAREKLAQMLRDELSKR